MDHPTRLRDIPVQPPSITFTPPTQPAADASRFHPDPQPELDRSDPGIAFMKGPKRKRLAKARIRSLVSEYPLTF